MKLLSKFHLMVSTLDILVPKFFLEYEETDDAGNGRGIPFENTCVCVCARVFLLRMHIDQ